MICTVRDDFLMRIEALPALGRRVSAAVFLLGNPSHDDLVRTIVEPARRAGYELSDPELAAEMATSVEGRPGALALLSFTVSRLWELRDRRFRQLTRGAYEGMGGVGGALGKHAEETLAALPAGDQRLVRAAFRRLVTSQRTRAQLSIVELVQALGSDRAQLVIDKLVAARLLVVSDAEDSALIELAHEALLMAWPRAQQWIHEDAEGARMRDQLRTAARQWVERGRPRGLLWRDDVLLDLEHWRRRPEIFGLTAVEQEFADASRNDARRARRFRRILAGGAFAVLAAAIVVLLRLNAEAERQREKVHANTRLIAASAAEAKRKLAEQARDQGRVALLDGRGREALRRFREAIELGVPRDPALDFMVARASRSVDAQRAVLAGHTKRVTSLTASRDGRLLSTSDDGTVRIWDPQRATTAVAIDTKLPLGAAKLDATGRHVLVAATDASSRVFATTGQLVHALEPPGWTPGSRFTAGDFDPRGELVVTATGRRHAYLWSATSGQLVATLDANMLVFHARWNSDGSGFAVAGVDLGMKAGVIELRDRQGKLVARLQGHTGFVSELAFSPHHALLATGSWDRTARLWDARTGKLLYTLDGHGDFVDDVAFDPSGRHLVTASRDHTARIWDVRTGRLANVLEGHRAALKRVANRRAR